MGVQIIGPKKTRLAAEKTGLPIFRALAASNYTWYGFVREGDGHWHVSISPQTWEWQIDDVQFSSCREGQWGPHVDPPASFTETVQT